MRRRAQKCVWGCVWCVRMQKRKQKWETQIISERERDYVCTVSMHANECVSVYLCCTCVLVRTTIRCKISWLQIVFRHNELSYGLRLTTWTKLSAIRAQALAVCTWLKYVWSRVRPVKRVCGVWRFRDSFLREKPSPVSWNLMWRQEHWIWTVAPHLAFENEIIMTHLRRWL